jgi:siroheme synthase (precorrin-2 oxidase/ferrochelatase)
MLYPVMLDLRGRPVVVVGAGAVAARKIAALVEAGAERRRARGGGTGRASPTAD